MDPKLLALTLDLQSKARNLSFGDNLEFRFAALDMLDYLGQQIDADRQKREAATAKQETKG